MWDTTDLDLDDDDDDDDGDENRRGVRNGPHSEITVRRRCGDRGVDSGDDGDGDEDGEFRDEDNDSNGNGLLGLLLLLLPHLVVDVVGEEVKDDCDGDDTRLEVARVVCVGRVVFRLGVVVVVVDVVDVLVVPGDADDVVVPETGLLLGCR